jgi:hypothetical protein
MPLVLTTATNPGSASFSAFAGSIFTLGEETVDAQSDVIAAPGVLATDMVFATLKSDDTGSTLGAIIGAVAASDQITIDFTNAPSNNDGVVAYFVIRPDAP